VSVVIPTLQRRQAGAPRRRRRLAHRRRVQVIVDGGSTEGTCEALAGLDERKVDAGLSSPERSPDTHLEAPPCTPFCASD
jgi:hypothetical protein